MIRWYRYQGKQVRARTKCEARRKLGVKYWAKAEITRHKTSKD